jgi:hypothetical protein
MNLEGMRKLTISKMEGHAMLHLKALMRKTAYNDDNNSYYYYHHHHHFLSQVFSLPWYFSP